MKKSLLALSLGLLSATAMNTAFANTGIINFEGSITADTCPITIIDPGNGASNSVDMGSVPAASFTAANQERVGKRFNVVIPDQQECKGTSNEANVLFAGSADSSGSYFAIKSGANAADNIAIAIRDSNSNLLVPGTQSADMPLAASGDTVIPFYAYYRSIGFPVDAGEANADVNFTVTIK
ncbi:type 1 fimbrial protein [Pseudomonas sp. SWRI59]|uniref:fimbrial protein n=1 Tax=Pseudomonas TaxID=286 RepID=UPI0016466DED|nr:MULTISPECIES: fimbrial protein [unclassified Pseudomonas]MBC3500399.1 type 1 fimbrial protein [Pseudomonas sp. SWRI59]MBC3507933.1 type 1 fimbrial protein [Pseudomonas sp. SWRI68]UVL05310.1 type 1 fimbrial protein [Pseudomonas sp. B21-047]